MFNTLGTNGLQTSLHELQYIIVCCLLFRCLHLKCVMEKVTRKKPLLFHKLFPFLFFAASSDFSLFASQIRVFFSR